MRRFDVLVELDFDEVEVEAIDLSFGASPGWIFTRLPELG